MALNQLPVPWRPTNLDDSRTWSRGGWGCLDIFILLYLFSSLSSSLPGRGPDKDTPCWSRERIGQTYPSA